MHWDIGVFRREAIPAQSAPRSVAASEAFTAAVAERYTPQAITVSHADLALAWEPPAEINYFYGPPRIEISPSVTVEERYVFGGALRKDVAGATIAAAGYGETEAGALFERLFSRHMRVAAFDSAQAPSPRRDPASSGERRMEMFQRPDVVERILPRARAIEQKLPPPPETAATVPPVTREAGWGTPLAFPEQAKPVILPAPEIKRVAEQVMREIDRRVIAHKERIGRR